MVPLCILQAPNHSPCSRLHLLSVVNLVNVLVCLCEEVQWYVLFGGNVVGGCVVSVCVVGGWSVCWLYFLVYSLACFFVVFSHTAHIILSHHAPHIPPLSPQNQTLPHATVEACVFDNAHHSALLVEGTGNQSINIHRNAFFKSYNASTVVVTTIGVQVLGNIVLGTTREGAPWGPLDRHVPVSFDYFGDDVTRVAVCVIWRWWWCVCTCMSVMRTLHIIHPHTITCAHVQPPTHNHTRTFTTTPQSRKHTGKHSSRG